MKSLRPWLLALIAACLAGTAPTTRPALPPLSESETDFRRSETERFTEVVERDERRYR